MKVFVGLSGGVDSSVSAALLKQATPNNFEKLFGRPAPKEFKGFSVTGVFIKVWQPDFLPCNWKEERLDAMRVCAQLGIPFVSLDLEKEYKQNVVDYMIDEYKAGRTPNPDVMCNRHVKFGGFFRWAMEQGADFVATGHYARTESCDTHDGEVIKLLAGCDENKDQSYFLWTLTQNELKHTLFPVGHLEKPAVRRLARKFGLITADKKDSQGLCFVGKVDMKEFLKHYISSEQGKVLNEKGEAIGTHEGATFYTIGERHGFTITSKTPNDAPYYIIGKDSDKNLLIVSNEKNISGSSSNKRDVKISSINWIREIATPEKIYSARIRYRAPLKNALIKSVQNNEATVSFLEEQRSITSGQSLVLYDSEECIGGGIIE